MTDQKIKVLYTIPNFITAGSGHALLSVARRLDKERFEPSICVLEKGGKMEEEIAELGIPLLELPSSIPARPITDLPMRILKAAQQFRPYDFDVWHSYHYSDDYTEGMIAKAAGSKWIYTKKNMSWHGNAWKLRTFLASGIGAQNSDMIEKFFTRAATKAKSELIPPGVDITHFKPSEPRLQMRQQLGIPAGAKVLGVIAHLVPVKGHPILLKAMAQIPGVHLIIAGRPMDEAYTAQLHQIVADHAMQDRIHFVGNVSDVPALHAELDAFVLPTLAKFRMEGCPVAMLEAMACENVAIVTRIPGPTDVITSGKNGFLVDPEDVDAMVKGINEALALTPDERQHMVKAAREHIVNHYTIEIEVSRYEKMYSRVVNAN